MEPRVGLGNALQTATITIDPEISIEDDTKSETAQPPVGEAPEPAVRRDALTMRWDLGFEGQMRQLEILGKLPSEGSSIPLFQDHVMHADSAAPSGPTAAQLLAALPAKLDAAKISPKMRDELMALGKNRSGLDIRILVQNTEKALKSSNPADALKSVILQTRTDDHFEAFNATYKVDGTEVQATPHFRMTNGMSGPKGRTSSGDIQTDLNILISTKDKAHYNQAMKNAIHGVAYGRATPQQIKMVTESLIRSGEYEVAKKKYAANGLNESDTIRMMQWDHGVGIDCAGYVQQAFMAVHGGGRAEFGFREFENEDLMSLKGNKHFAQVKPQDVRPGDLIALDKPPGESVGHTVLVRDRHMMSNQEIGNYQDPNGFIKAGDKVHIYEVDASFGGGRFGDYGGLVRKKWMYNERTGEWAEAVKNESGDDMLQKSVTNGPYNHPMNGIYRPKGK